MTRGQRTATLRLSVGTLIVGLLLAGCTPSEIERGPAGERDGLSGVGKLPAPASAWPSAQFDARHSSATSATGPQTGKVRWSRDLGGSVTPGPVIGVDGSILAATNAGVLHALDPATGNDRWVFDGGARYGSDLSTSPAVLGDGTILWPGPRSTLFALDRSGRLIWTEKFGSDVLSPAIAGHNRVYVADLAGHLAALDVTANSHRRVWTLDLGGVDYSSPSVGPDGTIYTAIEKQLIAVRDTGDSGVIRWRFETTKRIEVSSGVSESGIVVLGTNNDHEYGVRSDGTRAWQLLIHDYTYSSSTVRPDGRAYFADNSGRVRTVDSSTGRIIRTIAPVAPAKEHAWTSIVVDARSDTYWGSMNGRVYGYDANGHRLFALSVDSGVSSYPALGVDGTLYVGTVGGLLYAIGAS
ncbi:outer membrane protein assembly factor BamB family protein [Lacisediminihabitans sp. FW035]